MVSYRRSHERCKREELADIVCPPRRRLRPLKVFLETLDGSQLLAIGLSNPILSPGQRDHELGVRLGVLQDQIHAAVPIFGRVA